MASCVDMLCVCNIMTQRILVNLPQFVFKEYGGLTSLADLDIHCYLYIIIVLVRTEPLEIVAYEKRFGGLTTIYCMCTSWTIIHNYTHG